MDTFDAVMFYKWLHYLGQKAIKLIKTLLITCDLAAYHKNLLVFIELREKLCVTFDKKWDLETATHEKKRELRKDLH